jgi:hypothetical protein
MPPYWGVGCGAAAGVCIVPTKINAIDKITITKIGNNLFIFPPLLA